MILYETCYIFVAEVVTAVKNGIMVTVLVLKKEMRSSSNSISVRLVVCTGTECLDFEKLSQ